MDLQCDCSCDLGGEMGECIFVTKPVARKQHKCIECAGVIEPGERYERVKGLWEGKWSSTATCFPCMHMRETLCPCAPIGSLLDEIYQNNKESEHKGWNAAQTQLIPDEDAIRRNEELAWMLGLDELWASWKAERDKELADGS